MTAEAMLREAIELVHQRKPTDAVALIEAAIVRINSDAHVIRIGDINARIARLEGQLNRLEAAKRSGGDQE